MCTFVKKQQQQQKQKDIPKVAVYVLVENRPL